MSVFKKLLSLAGVRRERDGYVIDLYRLVPFSVGLAVSAIILTEKRREKLLTVSASTFLQLLQRSLIKKAEFISSQVRFELKNASGSYSTQLLPESLDRVFEKTCQSCDEVHVGSIVPQESLMLIMWALAYLYYNRESFFSSPTETREETLRFSDVGGMDEVKEELLEIVDYVRHPENSYRLGGVPPKGLVFEGPSGTGKTLLARALAGEAGCSFFSISASAFVEVYVGRGAQRVREIFQEARKNLPAIVFLDELDSVGSNRDFTSQGSFEYVQTLNQLLVELDTSNDENLIFVGATNRVESLDPALLRPGRVDRVIRFPLPDLETRKSIAEVYFKKVRHSLSPKEKVSFWLKTKGLSGAEIRQAINDACLLASRQKKMAFDFVDIEFSTTQIQRRKRTFREVFRDPTG